VVRRIINYDFYLSATMPSPEILKNNGSMPRGGEEEEEEGLF